MGNNKKTKEDRQGTSQPVGDHSDDTPVPIKETLHHYRRNLIVLAAIFIAIVVALEFGIDKKIVVMATVILGVFTQVFSGLGALIAMIPWIGPLIIKVFTIPFFWLLNALGYFVSVVAIKKGYSKEVLNSRTLTIALLTGIVIGYIIGHLFPFK